MATLSGLPTKQLLINSNHSLHLKLHKDNDEDAQEFPGVFGSFGLISVRFLHQFYIKSVFPTPVPLIF
jgi:hypothetical protein